ncbi:proteasome subunit alpha type-1 isoform X1 [Zeugodacus cucurbitae]|uniref:Proteasome subunit alpha type-1 n=1 Tax=Zeugodacus cucurbitae TaxID=28588 RepID=A0A0A1WXB7_ZEUCU|nr:proteasome subunit alpha type-1 isoform X1 [Zeugodacus cucurbitae]
MDRKNKTCLPVVAIKSADLVILVASAQFYQIRKIDEYIAFSYAGNQPNGNDFFMHLVEEAGKYKFAYSTACPMIRLVKHLCKKIQIRTQRYDRKPYDVEVLLTGCDDSGIHIYHIDSSGNFYECNAMAIGSGSKRACEYLEKLLLTNSKGILCAEDELKSHGLQAFLDACRNDEKNVIATIGTKRRYERDFL